MSAWKRDPVLEKEAKMEICVFCGSSDGSNPTYRQTAFRVGGSLARRRIGLIYGGGKVGLMGALADGALAAGGAVVGIIPRPLVEREICHRGLTSLIEVESMSQRKLAMSERADAFLALPGGAGTLEELLEQWTWAQLGIHRKPCAILNVDGYFDPLLSMIDKMVENGFLEQTYRDMLIIDSTVDAIIDAFADYVAPREKWRLARVG